MSDDSPELAEQLDKLSVKERAFCNAYAGNAAGNGVRAAELAGYSGDRDVLATQAWRLLRKAEIKAALEAMVESDPLVPARVERLRTLGKIVRGEQKEYKMTGSGDVVELPTSPQAIMAACELLSKLSGEMVTKVAQTNGAGEDVKGMTNEQLFAMAAFGKGSE